MMGWEAVGMPFKHYQVRVEDAIELWDWFFEGFQKRKGNDSFVASLSVNVI